MNPKHSVFTRAAFGDFELKPTIYKVQANPDKIFDARFDEEIIKDIGLRKKDLMSSGYFDWSKVKIVKQILLSRGYDAMWTDEGSQGISLAMFDWSGKVKIIDIESVH